MKIALPRHLVAPAASCLALALAASPVHAASGTWSVDADGNWTTTATNWAGSIIPGTTSGDVVNLTYDFTADRIVTLTTIRTLGILNLGDTNGTHAVTLQGSSLHNFTFDNGANDAQINQVSTGKGATISTLNMIVGGNGTLVVSNASTTSTLAISANITGSGGGGTRTVLFDTAGTVDLDPNRSISNGSGGTVVSLVKSGSGTLRLRAGGNYSGGVTLNSGTLEFGYAQNALGTGTFTINGGVITNGYGQLRTNANNNAQVWNANFTFGVATSSGSDLNLGTGAVTMTGNRTVTVASNNAARTLTVGGIISGDGFSLTKAGTATLALGGVNTYDGGTIVSAGTLATLSTGGDFGFGNVSLTTSTSRLTLGNAASIADSATLTFSSSLVAAGAINLNFDGVEILAGLTRNGGAGGSIVAGLYTADQLNTYFNTTIFTGTGSFQFGAVPEPSSYAAILGALVLVGVTATRRRR